MQAQKAPGYGINLGLNVRKTEALVKKYPANVLPPIPNLKKPPLSEELDSRLRTFLGQSSSTTEKKAAVWSSLNIR